MLGSAHAVTLQGLFFFFSCYLEEGYSIAVSKPSDAFYNRLLSGQNLPVNRGKAKRLKSDYTADKMQQKTLSTPACMFLRSQGISVYQSVSICISTEPFDWIASHLARLLLRTRRSPVLSLVRIGHIHYDKTQTLCRLTVHSHTKLKHNISLRSLPFFACTEANRWCVYVCWPLKGLQTSTLSFCGPQMLHSLHSALNLPASACLTEATLTRVLMGKQT